LIGRDTGYRRRLYFLSPRFVSLELKQDLKRAGLSRLDTNFYEKIMPDDDWVADTITDKK
jgi:hypothetical protein